MCLWQKRQVLRVEMMSQKQSGKRACFCTPVETSMFSVIPTHTLSSQILSFPPSFQCTEDPSAAESCWCHQLSQICGETVSFLVAATQPWGLHADFSFSHQISTVLVSVISSNHQSQAYTGYTSFPHLELTAWSSGMHLRLFSVFSCNRC